MAEIKMANVRDLIRFESSDNTISTLDDKYATISKATSISNKCNELQTEIDKIKKYNRRKNWVGNKINTYKRRKRQ